MKEEIESIGFSLEQIVTEQFAMFEENVPDKGEIALETSIEFGATQEDKILVVVPMFKFSHQEKPFLVIEIACHFEILEEIWNEVNTDSNAIRFPKNFIHHLTTISIGTVRGALHAKTENTKCNKFLLPIINVEELITADVLLEF